MKGVIMAILGLVLVALIVFDFIADDSEFISTRSIVAVAIVVFFRVFSSKRRSDL